MKKWVMLMLCLLVLAGCNTMSGMGKDMQAAGQKIEDASKKK